MKVEHSSPRSTGAGLISIVLAIIGTQCLGLFKGLIAASLGIIVEHNEQNWGGNPRCVFFMLHVQQNTHGIRKKHKRT